MQCMLSEHAQLVARWRPGASQALECTETVFDIEQDKDITDIYRVGLYKS